MSLQGGPSGMSLGDLLRVFRLGSKSGVLQLLHGDQHGVLYVCKGRVIDAITTRGPERIVTETAEQAVLSMLAWQDATFRFRDDAGVSVHPVRIEHDGEWSAAAVAAERERDEPPTARLITLDTQLQLSLTPASADHGVILNADRWRILSQLATGNTLRRACEVTGIDPLTAMNAARELLALGLVELVSTPPPARLSFIRDLANGRAPVAAVAEAPAMRPALPMPAAPVPHATMLRDAPQPVRDAAPAPLHTAPPQASAQPWPALDAAPRHAAAAATMTAPSAPPTEAPPVKPPPVSRGLLNSIMRRIRGL